MLRLARVVRLAAAPACPLPLPLPCRHAAPLFGAQVRGGERAAGTGTGTGTGMFAPPPGAAWARAAWLRADGGRTPTAGRAPGVRAMATGGTAEEEERSDEAEAGARSEAGEGEAEETQESEKPREQRDTTERLARTPLTFNVTNLPASTRCADLAKVVKDAWSGDKLMGDIPDPMPSGLAVRFDKLTVCQLHQEDTRKVIAHELVVRVRAGKEGNEGSDGSDDERTKPLTREDLNTLEGSQPIWELRHRIVEWLARRIYEHINDSDDVPASFRGLVLSFSEKNKYVGTEGRIASITRRMHHINKRVQLLYGRHMLGRGDSAEGALNQAKQLKWGQFAPMPMPFTALPKLERLEKHQKEIINAMGDEYRNAEFVVVNHVPMPRWGRSGTPKPFGGARGALHGGARGMRALLHASAMKHVLEWCVLRGFDPIVPYVEASDAADSLAQDRQVVADEGMLSDDKVDQEWVKAARLCVIGTDKYFSNNAYLGAPDWCDLLNADLPVSIRQRLSKYANDMVKDSRWDRVRIEDTGVFISKQEQGKAGLRVESDRMTCSMMLAFTSEVEAHAVARELHGTVMGYERIECAVLESLL